MSQAMSDSSSLQNLGSTQSTPLLLEASEILNECESLLPPLPNNESRDHRRLNWLRLGSYLASPFLEEEGSPFAVIGGLFTLFLVGTLLGLSLPKNEALITPWYRVVSSIIGYVYFLCWSVSFYPQIISNWKRKSTQGLSADFCGLNVLGFACYASYNLCFYYSPQIHQEYKRRHDGSEVTVQSNDVAFAVHAFILSTITFCQIGYYSGWRALQPHRLIGIIMFCIVSVCIVGCLMVLSGQYDWLDFLYMLSFVKVIISLIKYIPQMILNFQRKSTIGWSIWNIILDFTGGVLSDLQLVGDCADFGDWSGITGNLAKFGLGVVSISFDVSAECCRGLILVASSLGAIIFHCSLTHFAVTSCYVSQIIFMIQHYILYPDQGSLLRPLLQLPDSDDDQVENRREQNN